MKTVSKTRINKAIKLRTSGKNVEDTCRLAGISLSTYNRRVSPVVMGKTIIEPLAVKPEPRKIGPSLAQAVAFSKEHRVSVDILAKWQEFVCQKY